MFKIKTEKTCRKKMFVQERKNERKKIIIQKRAEQDRQNELLVLEQLKEVEERPKQRQQRS